MKRKQRGEKRFSRISASSGVRQKKWSIGECKQLLLRLFHRQDQQKTLVLSMMNRNNGTRERENRKGSKTFYLVNAPSDGIFRVDFRIAHRFTRKRVLRVSWISFVLLLERSRDSRGEQRGRCHHAECHFWDVFIRCVRCCVCVCVYLWRQLWWEKRLLTRIRER